MPNADLETKYLQALIIVARKKALLNKANLAFDPQGSVMIDIPREEIEAVLSTDVNFTTDLAKAFLAKKTALTTVSLDITSDATLNKKFIETVTDDDTQTNLDKLPKGSINPIFRELYFHMHATKRVYAKVFPNHESGFEDAFQATLALVNTRVMEEYKTAIAAAIKPLSVISIRSINKHLDKSRKIILAEAHSKFLHEAGVTFQPEQLQNLKDLVETTTATPNDIVYVGSNQVTWGAGNDLSSHDRQFGPRFGYQETVTHNYDGKEVTPNRNRRCHFRMASIAVKSGQKRLEKQGYIHDVAEKLAAFTIREDLFAVCDSYHQHASHPMPPRAIIYNLYTAINKRASIIGAIDERSNKQSESAEFILKGAHAYNCSQLGKNGVFCLVQAISVNGHGIPLGDTRFSPLTKEATLMTEMAVLHTLYDPSTPSDDVNDIFYLYALFLKRTPSNHDDFFSQSESGEKAIQLINELKTKGKLRTETDLKLTGHDVFANAKNCLSNLMINNRHFRNDATLFQALSVFTERVSMAGCKSANDYTPMINNRVAMLERALNEPDSQVSEIVTLTAALLKLATATPATIIQAEKKLKTALNAAVNNLGVQTQASMQTNAEIGGAAKYSARSWFVRYFGKWLTCWNTNAAEHSDMSTVAQEKATQVHKTMANCIASAQKNAGKEGSKPRRLENDNAAVRTQELDVPAHETTLKSFINTRVDDFPENTDTLREKLKQIKSTWDPVITQATTHNGYALRNNGFNDEMECYTTGKVTATSVATNATDDERVAQAEKIVAIYRAVNKPPGPVNLRCPNDDKMRDLLRAELAKYKFKFPPLQHDLEDIRIPHTPSSNS